MEASTIEWPRLLVIETNVIMLWRRRRWRSRKRKVEGGGKRIYNKTRSTVGSCEGTDGRSSPVVQSGGTT